MSDRTPTQITLNKEKNRLTIEFSANESYQFSAEFLRVYSPSAEVKGHGAEPRKVVKNKQNVQIMKIEPVGNYAIKIAFDDLHDTGIYSWQYFHELGTDQQKLWDEYQTQLKLGNDTFLT